MSEETEMISCNECVNKSNKLFEPGACSACNEGRIKEKADIDYALLAEVAKLIRYNAHSTIGISGAMRPADRGVYIKYDDVVEAIRRNFS
jgi:hypothetical protein